MLKVKISISCVPVLRRARQILLDSGWTGSRRSLPPATRHVRDLHEYTLVEAVREASDKCFSELQQAHQMSGVTMKSNYFGYNATKEALEHITQRELVTTLAMLTGTGRTESGIESMLETFNQSKLAHKQSVVGLLEATIERLEPKPTQPVPQNTATTLDATPGVIV